MNRWSQGSSDADIFRTITRGVPGTQMPANDLEENDVWRVIAWLRSLTPTGYTATGDSLRGKQLFHGDMGCIVCHTVNGSGGVLGPELSQVGGSRSITYLADSIRSPSNDLSVGDADPNDHYGLPPAYDRVTVVLKNGERIVGVARNEDPFSVQLIDMNQNLRLLARADLTDVIHERQSVMPTYGAAVLSDSQLNDVLAYLETLR